MYVGPGGNNPQLPREALNEINTLCGALFLPEAMDVLQRNQRTYSEGALVFAGIGHVSLENSNYERAFGAYLAAYTCAKRSGQFGAAALLEKLCDSGQLVQLLDRDACSDFSQYLRKALLKVMRRTLADPESPVTLPLLTKLLITTGEVGVSPKIIQHLEQHKEKLRSELERKFGKEAGEVTDGIGMIIRGHEMAARGEQSANRTWFERALQSYQQGLESLAKTTTLAELRSYLHLCCARLYGQQREYSLADLNVRFAAQVLEGSQSEGGPSLPSVVRIAKYAASQAIASPDLAPLHHQIVARFALPVHHTVGALALWSDPTVLRVRLGRATTEASSDEIIKDGKGMIQRAEFLSSDEIEDVPTQDRAQLHASKAWIAGAFDFDYITMLAEARKALVVAARDPSAMSRVSELLEELVWKPPSPVQPADLCKLFQEVLFVPSELPTPHCREAAEFRCQVLVGLANALAAGNASREAQQSILLPAMKFFREFLFDTDRDQYNIEIPALAILLRRGEEIWSSLPAGQDRDNCIQVLASLYQRKSLANKPFQDPDESLAFFQDALEVEEIAKKIYFSQRKIQKYYEAAKDARYIKNLIAVWKSGTCGSDMHHGFFGPDDNE